MHERITSSRLQWVLWNCCTSEFWEVALSHSGIRNTPSPVPVLLFGHSVSSFHAGAYAPGIITHFHISMK